MPETTPLIKAALNLRGGAGFDVYETTQIDRLSSAKKGIHLYRFMLLYRGSHDKFWA